MGIMDKILFWKKDDIPEETPLGLERDTLGLDLGKSQEPGIEPPSEVPPAPTAFAQAKTQNTLEKDIELISAKLDALKPLLDNMNQRLANIERIAQEAEKHEVY